MSERKDIRFGVIGLGLRGPLAGYAHRPEEGFRVVAGCDLNADLLKAFRERYGPEAFVTEDYRALLARSDVDAVFVLSPDWLHEEHALAALHAGKHVYLEKPMAITIDGCDRILAAARDAGVRLYVGHNMRHFSVIEKMKQLIDDGAVGQVKAAWCRHFISYGGDAYFKDWHAERDKCGGLLLQKGAHDIDVIHWLCGGYSRTVTALGGLTVYGQIADRHPPGRSGKVTFRLENWPPLSQKNLNPVIDVEDLSMMLMRLDNGVFAAYLQCHYTPDAWRNYTIIGTEGRIENFNDSGKATVRLWNRRCWYNEQGDEQFPFEPQTGTHGGADPKIIDEFLRYLRDGRRTATSPVAARQSVAAGCAATLSLRSGGEPVNVPPLDADLAKYFDK